MATDVTMPRLSDSMEEGTVLKWLVEVGGEVKRGEALVEIETDKANMTYEADTDGTLIEVVAQEGDTLAVGEVIARIGEAGEAPRESAAPAKESAPTEEEARADDAPAEEAPGEDASAEDAPAGDEPGEDAPAGGEPAEEAPAEEAPAEDAPAPEGEPARAKAATKEQRPATGNGSGNG